MRGHALDAARRLWRGRRYVGCDVARSQIYGLRKWFGPNAQFDAEAGWRAEAEDEQQQLLEMLQRPQMMQQQMLESKGSPIHRPELSFFVCDLGV